MTFWKRMLPEEKVLCEAERAFDAGLLFKRWSLARFLRRSWYWLLRDWMSLVLGMMCSIYSHYS